MAGSALDGKSPVVKSSAADSIQGWIASFLRYLELRWQLLGLEARKAGRFRSQEAPLAIFEVIGVVTNLFRNAFGANYKNPNRLCMIAPLMEHLDRVVTDQDPQVGFKLNLVGEIAIVGVFIHISGYNFLKRLTTEKVGPVGQPRRTKTAVSSSPGLGLPQMLSSR